MDNPGVLPGDLRRGPVGAAGSVGVLGERQTTYGRLAWRLAHGGEQVNNRFACRLPPIFWLPNVSAQ